MSQCLGVINSTHIEVKQPLTDSTERGKHFFVEQVLCDIEWSCDMCVVWLESRTVTELTHGQGTSLIQDSVLNLRHSNIDIESQTLGKVTDIPLSVG